MNVSFVSIGSRLPCLSEYLVNLMELTESLLLAGATEEITNAHTLSLSIYFYAKCFSYL